MPQEKPRPVPSVTSSDAGEEEALRLESRPSPVLSQAIAATVTAMTVTLLIAAITVPLEQVLSVSGKLVTRRSTQAVASPDSGIVLSVAVNEGQRVKKGELLLRFDPEVKSSQVSELASQLRAEINRLASERHRLIHDAAALERQLWIDEAVLGPLKDLARQGAVSELNVLEKDRILQATRRELQQSRDQLVSIAHESQKLQSQLRYQLLAARSKLQQIAVRAPVSGTVLELRALTGQVVPSNQTLLKIVPVDELEAKVFAPSKDLAFIRPGQEAKVAIGAYDYSLYGTIDAVVGVIAEDALPPSPEVNYPNFPVSLVLKTQVLVSGGKRFELQPGMAVDAKIKLQKRTFAQLLFSRLSRGLDAVRRIR